MSECAPSSTILWRVMYRTEGETGARSTCIITA